MRYSLDSLDEGYGHALNEQRLDAFFETAKDGVRWDEGSHNRQRSIRLNSTSQWLEILSCFGSTLVLARLGTDNSMKGRLLGASF